MIRAGFRTFVGMMALIALAIAWSAFVFTMVNL
jgi:hypothetical protein